MAAAGGGNQDRQESAWLAKRPDQDDPFVDLRDLWDLLPPIRHRIYRMIVGAAVALVTVMFLVVPQFNAYVAYTSQYVQAVVLSPVSLASFVGILIVLGLLAAPWPQVRQVTLTCAFVPLIMSWAAGCLFCSGVFHHMRNLELCFSMYVITAFLCTAAMKPWGWLYRHEQALVKQRRSMAVGLPPEDPAGFAVQPGWDAQADGDGNQDSEAKGASPDQRK